MTMRIFRGLATRVKHIKDGGKLLTLSDLYKDDIPGEANFFPYYPTSVPDKTYDKRLFINKKWQIHDELVPSYAVSAHRSISNHIIAGERFKIIGAKVPDFIKRHWEKSFNQEIVVRYGEINEEVPHVEMFPIESVKYDLHAVNPDIHFEISSKRFITEIPCTQAAELTTDTLQFPCYVKLCVQQGARGVWKVEDRNQLVSLVNHIKKNMPTADYIINEMVQNAKNTFSTIFYLSKKGKVKWIGVTEPLFAGSGLHGGGTVDMNMQKHHESMLAPIVRPVVQAIHKKGYFGVVDVDVVMNDKKQGFVVDINPRFGSTTKLMLLMLYLKDKGFTYGMTIRDLYFEMSPPDVIKFAEAFEDGKVVVASATETYVEEKFLTKCIFLIFGKSKQRCFDILDMISKPGGKTGDNSVSNTVCGGQSVSL